MGVEEAELLEVGTFGQRGENVRERLGARGWIKVDVEIREPSGEAFYLSYRGDAIGPHQTQTNDGRKEG